MKLLCKMFGHRQYSGWWGDGLYGYLVLDGVDGLGTQHFHIVNNCDRCGEMYVMARGHHLPVPQATATRSLGWWSGDNEEATK